MSRGYFICTTCQSEDVIHDAYAKWNREKQEYELVSTFDKGSWCNNCQGECRTEWIDEEEPKA